MRAVTVIQNVIRRRPPRPLYPTVNRQSHRPAQARRFIHTTLPRWNEKASFTDPTRSDLFYHLIHPPTPLSPHLSAFALSFLPRPPSKSDSATVIGWLPAETSDGNTEAGLNDFRENPKFTTILHRAIQDALRNDTDEIQRNGALQLQQGWMHIHDSRNIPALGRIGDPDDIIASVLVENSKILPETYQPMPSYRLCTSDGVLQLTPGLARYLQDALEAEAAREAENA